MVNAQSGDIAVVRTSANPASLLTLFPAGRAPNDIVVKGFPGPLGPGWLSRSVWASPVFLAYVPGANWATRSALSVMERLRLRLTVCYAFLSRARSRSAR